MYLSEVTSKLKKGLGISDIKIEEASELQKKFGFNYRIEHGGFIPYPDLGVADSNILSAEEANNLIRLGEEI